MWGNAGVTEDVCLFFSPSAPLQTKSSLGPALKAISLSSPVPSPADSPVGSKRPDYAEDHAASVNVVPRVRVKREETAPVPPEEEVSHLDDSAAVELLLMMAGTPTSAVPLV